MRAYEIGEIVERLSSDYTDGRKGVVIDRDLNQNRYQIKWVYNIDFAKLEKPVRTWVKSVFLKPAPLEIVLEFDKSELPNLK